MPLIYKITRKREEKEFPVPNLRKWPFRIDVGGEYTIITDNNPPYKKEDTFSMFEEQHKSHPSEELEKLIGEAVVTDTSQYPFGSRRAYLVVYKVKRLERNHHEKK